MISDNAGVVLCIWSTLLAQRISGETGVKRDVSMSDFRSKGRSLRCPRQALLPALKIVGLVRLPVIPSFGRAPLELQQGFHGAVRRPVIERTDDVLVMFLHEALEQSWTLKSPNLGDWACDLAFAAARTKRYS